MVRYAAQTLHIFTSALVTGPERRFARKGEDVQRGAEHTV